MRRAACRVQGGAARASDVTRDGLVRALGRLSTSRPPCLHVRVWRAGKLQINLSPLMWGMPTWQWAYTMSESGQVHLQFMSSSGAPAPEGSGAQQPANAAAAAAPPPGAAGLPPGLMSQAALSAANAVVAPKRVRSPSPTPVPATSSWASASSDEEGGARRPPPPPSKYGMLQRLTEIESEVDFTI